MRTTLRAAAFAGVALLALAGASAAEAASYQWFYGTGDTAGGIFHTDAAGNVVSGKATFNTGLGSITANIVPGSGTDSTFFWDNQLPVDGAGLLFRNSPFTQEFNVFTNGGPAGVGVTPNVALD